VSCAKMVELIEMQFGMLSWVGPGNTYCMGCRWPHGKRHFWDAWPTEKHCKA